MKPNKSVVYPGIIRVNDVPNNTILSRKGSLRPMKFCTAAARANTPNIAVRETQMICHTLPIIRRALLYTKI